LAPESSIIIVSIAEINHSNTTIWTVNQPRFPVVAQQVIKPDHASAWSKGSVVKG
jgi:hypothetical protein